MEDLSLHLLDIIENSVEAGARPIEARITEDRAEDVLVLEVADDGKGMDDGTLQRATDPFFTTRSTRRVGLGLSMLAEAARATGGQMAIESASGSGTRVRASFRPSHIDMKPVGDIPGTLTILLCGHPEIDLRYDHTVDGETFTFDTGDLDEDLASPADCMRIGESIRRGLADLRGKGSGGRL